MDPKNRFHTPSTWQLVRAEHLLLLVALCTLLAMHLKDVNWGRFALAFALIDAIGYIPGALAFRRAAKTPLGKNADVRISAVYHYLYNVTHSFLFAALAIGVWYLGAGWEWAMLALPIHLLGDRGLFGNVYKPISLPFEPIADAAASRDYAGAMLIGGLR